MQGKYTAGEVLVLKHTKLQILIYSSLFVDVNLLTSNQKKKKKMKKKQPYQMNYGFLPALKAAVTHGHIQREHKVINHQSKRLSLDMEMLQQLFAEG